MTFSISQSFVLRIVCVLHALFVSSIWMLVFKFEIDVLSGRVWLVIALSWLLWISQIVFPFRAKRMDWVATVLVGFVLLVPTVSTQYTFLAWAIEGFAP